MTKPGRILATAVAVIAGLFVLADMFIARLPVAGLGNLQRAVSGTSFLLVSWAAIIFAFALFLGFYNVVSVHVKQIRANKPEAIYSIVLLVSLAATLLVGFWGGPNGAGSQFIFDYILQPLEATFFALLALFIATAAFRAFRVHNLESFFFVLFAVIVLLGQVPLGIYLWSEFPIIKDWILNVPTMAGVRGILLGVALGTIATGLRVLLAADRPYTD
ncbi:MAG: hypothetical protein D6768_02045 [Chloroflexi bacterium]|nr:MAG: hypothetical protein D6768_02045 [Chloroflexota bacterium]